MPRPASRLALTLRSLVAMGILGAGLAGWSRYAADSDVAIATGPPSPQQERSLVEAADRPDIETFFKNLSPSQRLAMARNIGRYRDPKLAALCGKLLSSFDPQARAELTNSLSAIARAEPDSVASQLSQTGSFQALGVQQSLDAARPASLGAAAKQLESDAARQNAEAYLVHVGAASVPYLLSVLSSSDEPTRLAAEEAMGKLRARQAVAMLTQTAATGGAKEKEIAVTALASIADPSAEAILASVLVDSKLPVPLRSEAALGLGRIGTISAADLLWRYAKGRDRDLNDACLNALQLAGPVALRSAPARTEGQLLLRVASGIQGERAEDVITRALGDRAFRVEAARAAANRASLAAPLGRSLSDPGNEADGEYIEAAISSLETTAAGRERLDSSRIRQDPRIAGFVLRSMRRLEAASTGPYRP